MLLERFKSLPLQVKGAILLVLLGVIVTSGYTVYTRYKLHLAHQEEQVADRYRAEATTLRAEKAKLEETAAKLQDKLNKADAKVGKLQADLDKIKIPPRPEAPPETTSQVLADLQQMGLSLVQKPSLQIKPAVAGITQEDAGKVWFWGKEALRVDALEVKLVRQGDLITGLYKAKDLAESLAEVRGKEADTAAKVADLHQKEADSLRVVVKDVKAAMSAEQKKKYLYAAGAAALTYVVVKH